MLEKGILREVESTEPRIHEVTPFGLELGFKTLKTPVPAAKLVLDPSLVRLRIRGLQEFSVADRIEFYQTQLRLEEDLIKRLLDRDLNDGV